MKAAASKFLVFGVVYAGLGLWRGGAFGWTLAWLGASFILVSRAYASSNVRAFGKNDDGTLRCRNPLLWPHLALTWLAWRVFCWRSKEDPCNEVAPGLWVGRRAHGHELPAAIAMVVDLTAEFPEPRDVASRATYFCVPALDGTAIEAEALARAVARIVDCPGGVYVHCALGHGRSALLAAAVLMRKGLAPGGADEAVAIVTKARPGARLNEDQLRTLRGLA